jgi:ankyrin repeat protein
MKNRVAAKSGKIRIVLLVITASVLLLLGLSYLLAPLFYPQALLDAAERGDLERVRELLDKGVDIYYADGWSGTAMFYAAANCHTKIVELLLARGVDINRGYRMNKTPLICAAQFGCNETVRFLIKRGADVTLKDVNGQTALMHAVENNHSSTAAILREACASKAC